MSEDTDKKESGEEKSGFESGAKFYLEAAPTIQAMYSGSATAIEQIAPDLNKNQPPQYRPWWQNPGDAYRLIDPTKPDDPRYFRDPEPYLNRPRNI